MLTNKQAKCLDLIEKHWAEHKTCPSYEDLLPALGIKSKAGVHRLIRALEERGFVRQIPHRARSIEVIKPQSHLNAEYQRGFRDGAAWEAGKKASKRAMEKLRLVSASDPPCPRRI
jgi:SOS-response transcriptional repressor LexA